MPPCTDHWLLPYTDWCFQIIYLNSWCNWQSCLYFCLGCIIEEGADYSGHDILQKKVENQDDCAQLSFATESSNFWSYNPLEKDCWVKTARTVRLIHSSRVSGNSECGIDGQIHIHYLPNGKHGKNSSKNCKLDMTDMTNQENQLNQLLLVLQIRHQACKKMTSWKKLYKKSQNVHTNPKIFTHIISTFFIHQWVRHSFTQAVKNVLKF